jgi:hypothetical protein
MASVIPGQLTLDVPIPIPNEPIGATPAWRAAALAADLQCEYVACSRTQQGRCAHTLRAGYRLYLAQDGHVYCEDCSKVIAKAEAKARAAYAAPANEPDTLF